MKRIIFLTTLILTVIVTSVCLCVPAFAAENSTDAAQTATQATETEADASVMASTTSTKAIAAAVAVGLSAAVGAIAMAIAISKSTEGMARQPEAAGKINSAMMLGLVFIETLIIYALIVAILIIFVL